MRIAICIGGETRDYNDDPSNNLEYLVNRLRGDGHIVDVYGHTWAHCDLPRRDRVQFKDLQIEDQSIIDEWTHQDWINRLHLNKNLADEFNYNHDFHDNFDSDKLAIHNLDIDSIKRIEMSTRAGYAQHISGWKSFQLVNDDYDVYLRWRWDLIFIQRYFSENTDHYSGAIEFYYPFFVKALREINDISYSSADDDRLNFMFNGNTLIHGCYNICVDDAYFAFTHRAKQSIDSINIFDALADRFSVSPEEDYDTSHTKAVAHTLWSWLILDKLDSEGVVRFPACAEITYRDERFK